MGQSSWLTLVVLTVCIRACACSPLVTGPLTTKRIRSLLQASPPDRFQKPYNICTSDWAPIVLCADIDDPNDFSGFQIELWRRVAKDMGWADEDWTFSCVDWTAMIDDLISPDGKCSFAAAGVEVSLPNIVAGLKFSWPIYKSGFQVLIASHMEEGGIWAFAEAFHWSVWVTLGATALICSFLISITEYLTIGDQANKKGLRGWSWYAMGKIVQMQTHVGDPKTWASRIMVLGYAFLALIMVHLYTATTASKMTMARLANDITGKQDLPGKKVESWEPYVPLLRKYSIDATALPWDNDADTRVMLDNLRSRAYQALVLDAPVVQYFAAIAEHCDLYPVGDPWETFNIAIAFPPDTPDDLPGNVSASIVKLQTTEAILDRLENQFVKSAHTTDANGTIHSCSIYSDSSQSHSADPQIKFNQVLGLWYILAITGGIAIILLFIQFMVWRRKQLKQIIGSLTGGKSTKVAAAEMAGKDAQLAGNLQDLQDGEFTKVADEFKQRNGGMGVRDRDSAAGGGKPRQSAALASEDRTAVQMFATPAMPGEASD